MRCQSVCDIWDSSDTGCWDTPPVEPRRGSYVARAPPPRVHLGREPINFEWSADVRFGAHNGLKSDIAPCPKSANKRLMRCGIKSLFDQLVRAGEQRIRDRDPQGLGRLQVDDQYRLRRLLHRKIRRLLA